MARRGRKPIPLVTRLLEGNRNKGRIDLDEVASHPAVRDLDAPSNLRGSARKLWDRLAPILCTAGLLTVADREALSGLCQWWESWERAMKDVIQSGPVVRRKGGAFVNPSLRAAKIAWANVESGMTSFGLTPSARARLPVTKARPDLDKLLGLRDDDDAEAASVVDLPMGAER